MNTYLTSDRYIYIDTINWSERMLRPNFSRTYGCPHLIGSGADENTRLKRHKKWNDEGVASTVGTIMAMMVFLAALSMFTSQYVPVWMEENEASHMAGAYGQFAALKQAVDMQVLAGAIQGTANVQMFSPVKLGAEGIPMFAAPTPGYLTISRSNSYDNVSFSFNVSTSMSGFNASASIVDYDMNTGGTIKLYVGNRYYIAQELAFENDALILKQPDGQYMKATPQFTVTGPPGGPYQMSYTQLDLRGDNVNYIGFGTRGIKTIMKSTSTTTFTNLTSEKSIGIPANHPLLYINHTTYYERAWYSIFNQTLSSAGLLWGFDYNITSSVKSAPGSIDVLSEISVQINPNLISRFSLTIANIEISTSEMGAI
jgi:hypothetical protein